MVVDSCNCMHSTVDFGFNFKAFDISTIKGKVIEDVLQFICRLEKGCTNYNYCNILESIKHIELSGLIEKSEFNTL